MLKEKIAKELIKRMYEVKELRIMMENIEKHSEDLANGIDLEFLYVTVWFYKDILHIETYNEEHDMIKDIRVEIE